MHKTIFPFLFFCAQLLMGQNEISEHIANSFNKSENLVSIARSLGYKDGDKIRVITVFTVNGSGEIVDIKARSVHPAFEKEAVRVLSELGKMRPTRFKDKTINQKYTLPLNLTLESDKAKKRRLKKEKRKKEK